jgi:hypothetical protein
MTGYDVRAFMETATAPMQSEERGQSEPGGDIAVMESRVTPYL